MTPEEIEKARQALDQAVTSLRAYGKQVTPPQLVRVFLSLPVALYFTVGALLLSLTVGSYRYGKHVNVPTPADRNEVSGLVAFTADYPGSDIRPWVIAMTTYLEGATSNQVVRLQTAPFKHSTKKFTLHIEPIDGTLVTALAFLARKGGALQPLTHNRNGNTAAIAVPEAEQDDWLMLLLSVELRGENKSSNLQNKFVLSVREQ